MICGHIRRRAEHAGRLAGLLGSSCSRFAVSGIAIRTDHKPVLIIFTILTGIFIGTNNTITTRAVMAVSPVERPAASAAYSFVRWPAKSEPSWLPSPPKADHAAYRRERPLTEGKAGPRCRAAAS